MSDPPRRKLDHSIPDWVEDEAIFFVTICLGNRETRMLCEGALPQAVLDAMRFYHGRARWYVHLVLLMPDHLHALLSFPPHESLSRMLGQWKGYLAKTTGIEWQADFYDHRLRKEESLEEKAAYILENPIRAGLVNRIEDWPHWWRPD